MTAPHPPPQLLLNARDAARSLAVCPKTLWTITQPRGDLPCVRIGHRVLYSVSALQQWIDSKQKEGQVQ